jgi:hypothetical protein
MFPTAAPVRLITHLLRRAGLGKCSALHSAFCIQHFFTHHSSFFSNGASMDTVETYVANLILKALHKSAPALTPADDAKVTRTVADFVTAGMDLVAVYFAIRNAKK